MHEQKTGFTSARLKLNLSTVMPRHGAMNGRYFKCICGVGVWKYIFWYERLILTITKSKDHIENTPQVGTH